MKLTILNRIKIAWEALTSRSGHAHPLQEKQLSTFQRGYTAGMKDAKLYLDNKQGEVRQKQFKTGALQSGDALYDKRRNFQ